jgi:hypothetical protein
MKINLNLVIPEMMKCQKLLYATALELEMSKNVSLLWLEGSCSTFLKGYGVVPL